MQSKHNVITPEEAPVDEAGELELPSELVELGRRLSDDAAGLQAAYPAESIVGRSATPAVEATVVAAAKTNNPGDRAPSSGRLRSGIIALLCLALAVAVTPIAIYLTSDRDDMPQAIKNSAAPSESNLHDRTTQEDDKPVNHEAALTDLDKRPAPSHVEVNAWMSSPALLLPELSAPELDGMLDLMNDETPRRERVSI